MTKTQLIAEPGKQEILSSVVLNAPSALVFKAYTDPTLIPQWWGPNRLTTTIDQLEVRPGGRWRFVQRDPAGGEHAFHGVYHQVAAPERLVFTFEYEGVPGHVILETVAFEEQGNQTRVTDQMVFQSVKDRDGMLNSGMEEGTSESEERLGALLAKIRG